MKVKMVEIRDAATRIAAIAIKTQGETLKEHQLFRMEGFGESSVLLIRPEQQKRDAKPRTHKPLLKVVFLSFSCFFQPYATPICFLR